MLYLLLIILMVIVSVLMCLIVLIQKSKGGGLASGFASSNQIMGVAEKSVRLGRNSMADTYIVWKENSEGV